MELATADAYKEINFKFDDDITSVHNNTVNTEVVIHRKKRPLAASREEEDFRRNCREMNTSTPKKSDVKLAINEARSSFFGLDAPPPRRDSQMDTAELLAANCTEDSGATRITANGSETETEDSCRSCDINNNSDHHNTSKTKSELESGLGSISDDATSPSDEPDAICPEKELLLENDDDQGRPVPAPRNIIREPQYYKRASQPNPTQVSK